MIGSFSALRRRPGAMPAVVLGFVAVAAVAFSACGGYQEFGRLRAGDRSGSAGNRATAAADTCSATGAHAAHAGGFFQCQICHPCGGVLSITPTTLSDGFVVSGTATKDTSGVATCTVTCHGSQPVSWNSGPLGCSGCHGQWQGGAAVVSAHGIDPSLGLNGNAPICTNCHTTANHFDPGMALVNANDGSAVLLSTASDAQITTFCKSCHDGSGKTLGGSAPPLLVGYDTTSSGDFHGARAGTGFGGTLAPPFSVGQAPLDCVACHEPHASTNAFMFASTVNGQQLATGAVTRAGVGADALCQNCHLGDRHAGCKASGCHDGVSVYFGQTMTSEPVPANGPCFYCHGHEGIVNFAFPTWNNHPNGSGNYCWHCHNSGWFPGTVSSTPPAVSALSAVNIMTTSADITWRTSTPATSWVEFGATDVTSITGDATLTTTHKVTLTGLAPGATYLFRVRTSDAFRNLTEAPAQPLSFVTASSSVEPVPTQLVAYNDPLFPNDVASLDNPALVTLQWGKVTSASGSTVYRIQVSTSAAFTILLQDIPNVSATSVNVSVPNNSFYPAQTTYYWRVMAIDAMSGTQSPWATGSFNAYQYDPYG